MRPGHPSNPCPESATNRCMVRTDGTQQPPDHAALDSRARLPVLQVNLQRTAGSVYMQVIGLSTLGTCGRALRLDDIADRRIGVQASTAFSMPSVSGWALRRPYSGCTCQSWQMFLCPRCRAGRCDVCRILAALACGFSRRCAGLVARVLGKRAKSGAARRAFL